MPRPDELPEALKPLARRHAIRLDYETFDTQVDQLIAKLTQILAAGAADATRSERLPGDAVPTPAHGVTDVPVTEPLAPPPADIPPAAPETPPGPEPAARRRTVAVAAIGLLVLGLVGALIFLWPDSGSDGSGADTTTVTTVIGVRDRLGPGERLAPGELIATADGRHQLEMTTDGRLVLTTNGDEKWAPDRQGPPGSHAVMQDSDGNFVVYQPAGPFVWASGTTSDPGASLVVEDRQGEARITIYAPDGRDLWHRPLADVPEPEPTVVESTTATTAATTSLPETTLPGTTAPPTTTL
jgi:hypothetical protein